MTESQFQSKLRRALQARLPKAVIFKFNDRFTAGIPDLAVVHDYKTTWLELKVGKRPITPLQVIRLRQVGGFVVRWLGPIWYTQKMNSESITIADRHGFDFDNLVNHLELICR